MAHKNHDKKSSAAQPDQDQLREEIQQLAYTFYCQCGYEHGHDLEHWAEAERQVLEQLQRRPKTGG